MNYTELNYDGFERYLINEGPHPFMGGLCYEFKFDNEFGASVVKHSGSYGNMNDLFELAVLKNGSITYTTEITDDVLGWLSNEEVIEALENIMNLDN